MSNTTHQSDSTDRHESWAEKMTDRCGWMAHIQRPKQFTIYRVPKSIRQADESAYEPKMLSIGPYHHTAKPELEAMEEQKWLKLQHILSQHTELRLVDFIKEIDILEIEIRHCYSENINLEPQEFVEMMVLDGCFIVSILLSLEEEDAWDPIDEYSRWVWPNVVHDILLLENQVPFFVLVRLFDLITNSNFSDTDRLVYLAVKFFKVALPRMKRKEKKEIPRGKPFDHLLHLFHWYYSFSTDHENIIPIYYERQPVKMIPPAFEIRRAGIKMRKDDGDMLNVKFSRKEKVLKIPTLHLNYQTISFLRNLIALEQCSYEYGTDFTSYGFFLDCLIDTTEDVALLKRQFIIEHEWSMDKDVALQINHLRSGISFDIRHGYMQSIFKEVLDAYESELNSTFSAWLRRIYFMKPSDKLQLQVGLLSVYLSVMQTIFTVLSYRRPS